MIVFRYLYTFYCFVLFVVPMLAFVPLFWLSGVLLNQKQNLWVATTLMLVWFRLWSWLSGIWVSTYNRRLRKGHQPCVYVSNHCSYLDTFSAKLALGYGFMPLGKKEQTKAPILGTIYKHNVILVDRSNAESRAKSMDYMRETLAKGISLLLFAEGTMNRTPYILKNFYDGAFRLAIEAQVPIVPMVGVGGRELLPRGSFLPKPGWIRNYFLPPIPTAGKTTDDVDALKRETYFLMYDALRKLASENAIGKFEGPDPAMLPTEEAAAVA